MAKNSRLFSRTHHLSPITQHLLPVLALVFIIGGCGGGGKSSDSPDGGLSLLAWTATTPSKLDNNTGLSFTPRVAVETDPANNGGADTDNAASAVAVWLERKDLNLFDTKPAIYHVYASRWNGATWTAPTLMDTGSPDYNAWSPRVAMDNQGNAIVVFEQADGTDCDAGVAGTQVCLHVYARRYAMGTGWEASPLRVDNSGGSFGAGVSPAVAMESNPAVNDGVEDTLPSLIVTFAQWDGTDSTWKAYAARATALTGAWPAPAMISPSGAGREIHSIGRTMVDWLDRTTVTTPGGGSNSNPTDVGQFSSLAVSSDGRLYSSYYDVTNQDLRFATCDGAAVDCAVGDAATGVKSGDAGLSNWTKVCVDGQASPACTAAATANRNTGLHTSIAVDNTAVNPGRLYLAYNENNAVLRVVSCLPAAGNSFCAGTAAGTWLGPFTIAAVDGQYTSLKIDLNGRLHLAYHNAGTTKLFYTTCLPAAGNGFCTTGGWQAVFQVDAVADNGEFASLAIDTTAVNPNRLYVTYQDVTGAQLKFATCGYGGAITCNAGGNWTLLGIAGTSAAVTQYTSLGVDSTGRLHAAFHNPATTRLRYATCPPAAGNTFCSAAAGNWSLTDVDAGPANGLWASLAVDANNRVHVVYNRAPLSTTASSPAGAIKYATCASGGGVACATAANWDLFLVQDSFDGQSDGTTSIGTHLSMALDPAFAIGTGYDPRSLWKYIRVMEYSEVDNYINHVSFRLTTGFTSPGGVSSVAMDAAGRATVAMVLTPLVNCSRSAPQDSVGGGGGDPRSGSGNVGLGGATTGYPVDCGNDMLFVNRFNPTTGLWLGALDASPVENLGVQSTVRDTNCEDIGNLNHDTNNTVNGATTIGDLETIHLASPCVDLGPPSVMMDNNGNAILALKTFQWVTETTAEHANADNNHFLYPNVVNQRIGIVSKTYSSTATWETNLGKYYGTTTAAAATTLTDGFKNGVWTANQWVGATVTILNGNGYGQTRTITASTAAGVLTVTPAWTTTPAAGDPYIINLWAENALSQYEITLYPNGADATTALVNASTCGTNTNGVPTAGVNPAPNYVTDVSFAAGATPATNDWGTTYNSYIYIMNCNMSDPVVAMDPNDGASAMVTYERYGGITGLALSRRVIVVHRCIEGAADAATDTACGSLVGAVDPGAPPTTGTEWGLAGTYAGFLTTVRDADNCTNALALATVGNCWGSGTGVGVPAQVDAGGTTDAFSPRIAMDNNGNAMLVWTQKDGTGKWRSYARRFCSDTRAAGTASCTGTAIGWGPLLTLDAGGGNDYFEPQVAVEHSNPDTGATHNAANCGANTLAGCGDAMAVFNELIASTVSFRIDASRWTPP